MGVSTSKLRDMSPKQTGLSRHWIAEGVMDAEYKEYVLLAWLQKLKAEFKNTRLYPALSDIIGKHKELKHLQHELTSAQERSPLTGLDFRRMRTLRAPQSHQPELESYLAELIQRALPHLRLAIEEGKALYDLIDSQLKFTPVGVQPFHVAEGYLLVTIGAQNQRHLQAFRYSKSKVIRNDDTFLELRLRRIESRHLSRLEQPEHVKWSLIHRHKDLPQPATYHAHLDQSIPVQQTLLPIARRKLLQEISADRLT